MKKKNRKSVEEQLQVVSRDLGIVNIGYPEFADIVVVSLPHLIVDQPRLSRAQPQAVVRPPHN